MVIVQLEETPENLFQLQIRNEGTKVDGVEQYYNLGTVKEEDSTKQKLQENSNNEARHKQQGEPLQKEQATMEEMKRLFRCLMGLATRLNFINI